MDRKLQRHRADSLRQHGFLVIYRSSFTSHHSLSSKLRPYKSLIYGTLHLISNSLQNQLSQITKQPNSNVHHMPVCQKAAIFKHNELFTAQYNTGFLVTIA